MAEVPVTRSASVLRLAAVSRAYRARFFRCIFMLCIPLAVSPATCLVRACLTVDIGTHAACSRPPSRGLTKPLGSGE